VWTTRKAESFAKNWKKEHPLCADCSSKHGEPVYYKWYQLEFDHVGPKRVTLGYARQLRTLTEDELRREIAMCDIVCRNCHAERTYQRRVQKRLEKRAG
jgi:hypothetical protein